MSMFRGASKLALGVGMAGAASGYTLALLTQPNVINRLFPNEPTPAPMPEKREPSIDFKMVEEMMSQNRKINQLEFMLSQLKDDIKERDRELSQKPQVSSAGNVDVLELSQVLEANNLAAENRLKREVEEMRSKLLREHLLKVEGEVLKVENKYRPTINKIKELENILEVQNEAQKNEAPARLLWISCQTLLDRIRHSPETPLEKEPAYEMLRQFAANNNPLAMSVLDSIPAKAIKDGIQSEEALISRFSEIERLCKRVAFVDEQGGGVGKYLLSYLQSLFLIENVKVSEDEVTGKELVDPTSWQTNDILARVRYCLLRRNLEQAARYANQLRGQPRVVARDWIRDVRMYLEIRQALSTLSAHAEAIAVNAARHMSYVE